MIGLIGLHFRSLSTLPLSSSSVNCSVNSTTRRRSSTLAIRGGKRSARRLLMGIGASFFSQLTSVAGFGRGNSSMAAARGKSGVEEVSHFPAGYKQERVVGLGLNEEELKRKRASTEYVVQDLKINPQLPFEDRSFDVITNVVSVDYLTKPIEVFREMCRVLKPGASQIDASGPKQSRFGHQQVILSMLGSLDRTSIMLEVQPPQNSSTTCMYHSHQIAITGESDT
ncbi:hypothetical protein AKJ16_DCAP10465 [Drosera capensis]